MPETLAGPITLFDVAAIIIILISALMAVSRGFMRELATLGAFVAAVAAAYYARLAIRDVVASSLPDTLPVWTADAVIIGTVFFIVYVVAAWAGQKLSRSVNGPEGLGLIDRIAGMIFGFARGVVALVFFVMLINMMLKPEQIPAQITDAKLFPMLNGAAEYISSNAPRLAENVEAVLPDTAEQAK